MKVFKDSSGKTIFKTSFQRRFFVKIALEIKYSIGFPKKPSWTFFFIYTLAISLCACSSPLLFTYLTPVPLLFYSHASVYSSPLVEFLVSKIPISHNLFTESISTCIKPQLTRFFKPAMECGSANVVTDLLHANADVTATVECLMPLAIRVRSLHTVKLLEAFDCKIDELVLHKVATMDRINTILMLHSIQKKICLRM